MALEKIWIYNLIENFDGYVFEYKALMDLKHIIGTLVFAQEVPGDLLEKACEKALKWQNDHENINHYRFLRITNHYLKRKGYTSIDCKNKIIDVRYDEI